MARRSLFGILKPGNAAVDRVPVKQRGPLFPGAAAGPAAAPDTSTHLAFLQVGQQDLSETMFRALRIKGQLPKLIDPRFNVSIQGEDFTKPEYWWLRRGILGYVGDFVGAVAGQFSFIDLSIAQRRLSVIESIVLTNRNGAAASYRFGFGAAVAVGGTNGNQPRDDRTAGRAITTLMTSGTNAAPLLGPNDFFISLAPGTSIVIPGPYIMTGIQNFHCIMMVVNQELMCHFNLRERELYPEEQ